MVEGGRGGHDGVRRFLPIPRASPRRRCTEKRNDFDCLGERARDGTKFLDKTAQAKAHPLFSVVYQLSNRESTPIPTNSAHVDLQRLKTIPLASVAVQWRPYGIGHTSCEQGAVVVCTATCRANRSLTERVNLVNLSPNFFSDKKPTEPSSPPRDECRLHQNHPLLPPNG